jgi:hypothetical protein
VRRTRAARRRGSSASSCVDLGAWEGMKLDGGGSSTLFIAGRGTVNRPSDGHPRAVATHLGVVVRREVPARAPSRCRAVSP